MAHEIDLSTGKAAAFYAGEPAWHKLGTVIDKAQNSADAIKLAGLDWTVEQWPVRAFNPDKPAEEAACVDRVANVRTDTKRALAIVSKGYKVFQNSDAFDFMDAIVGEKLAMYETAGSLKGGKRVWMLARIPKEFKAAKGDVVQPYVLLTNGHDGAHGLRMIPTTVRVVCMNTLNLAMRNSFGSDGLSIGHWGNLDERVSESREKLGLISQRFDLFTDELRALVEAKLTDRKLAKYFDGMLPAAETERQVKTRDAVLVKFQENLHNERNAMPGIRGTVWAAYNAVSEFADHQRKFIGKTAADKADNQLQSIWFGDAHKMKQKAYADAIELAGVGA
jgi:phage/plasmid-like protein (TIGR03299 family)